MDKVICPWCEDEVDRLHQTMRGDICIECADVNGLDLEDPDDDRQRQLERDYND